MARAGPRKVRAYSREFERAAVELSRQVGVQVHGEGPFAITYIKPKDDPRNASAHP